MVSNKNPNHVRKFLGYKWEDVSIKSNVKNRAKLQKNLNYIYMLLYLSKKHLMNTWSND